MARSHDFMLKADRKLLAARYEERRLKWEKMRRRGMAFYVLVWWTLRFGGVLCAWFVFSELYLHYEKLHGAAAIYAYAVPFIIAALVGIWDWYSNEKRYRKSE